MTLHPEKNCTKRNVSPFEETFKGIASEGPMKDGYKALRTIFEVFPKADIDSLEVNGKRNFEAKNRN